MSLTNILQPNENVNAVSGHDDYRFSVFKQGNRYMWILFSSNPYRDNDKEIVSLKALENDVDRMDAEGNYGPLRWWHVPGLDIGQCEFNMMKGKILIEAGHFYSNEVAEKIKEHMPELKASIGFRHPLTEPDENGVYHNIRRFERSLVPNKFVGNSLTGLPYVIKEENVDIQQKLEAFKAMVGMETAEKALSAAEQIEKQADEQKLEFKEVDTVELKCKDGSMSKMSMDEFKACITGAVGDYFKKDKEDKESKKEAKSLADVTVDELREILSLKEASEDESDSTPVSEMTVDEFQEAIGVKELKVQLDAVMEALQLTQTKESKSAEALESYSEKVKEVQASVTGLTEQLSGIAEGLNELQGNVPKSLRDRRASQADSTVVKETKFAQPQADPLTDFIQGFVIQQ